MKCKEQRENIKQGWTAALEDAKRKHSEGRAYVSRMRAVIRGIERKMQKKEPFPGEVRKESSA
jgi:hypothetical protein